MGRIIKPKTMTVEEMEADVKAAEEAAKKEAEQSQQPAPEPPKQEEPTPEPPKEEEPKPDPAKEQPAPEETKVSSAELEALKTAIAEKEARIAELTKRVRDEDGRNGGKLAELQTSVTKLGDQLRQVMEENRELRKQKPAEPVTPPEPDTLETEYPEVAKGVDKRAKPAMDAAARAEQMAKEAKEETQKLIATQRERDYAAFLTSIRTAIPKMDDYNSDPEFLAWCKSRSIGTPYARQQVLDICSQTMNPTPVIELFQQWEKEKTPVTIVPSEPAKAKPSKEAQQEVPRSSAAAAKAKPAVDVAKRLREIEDKIFRFGTGTAEDRLEYDRLLDAQEREAKT